MRREDREKKCPEQATLDEAKAMKAEALYEDFYGALLAEGVRIEEIESDEDFVFAVLGLSPWVLNLGIRSLAQEGFGDRGLRPDRIPGDHMLLALRKMMGARPKPLTRPGIK